MTLRFTSLDDLPPSLRNQVAPLLSGPQSQPLLSPAPAPTKPAKRSKDAAGTFGAQCTAAGLRPERELKFALSIGRKWAFDFAWPAVKVAVEIEGLVPRAVKRKTKQGRAYTVMEAGGRHATMQGFEEDARKYATAALLGWTVLRFNQRLVRNGEALQFTRQLLDTRGA